MISTAVDGVKVMLSEYVLETVAVLVVEVTPAYEA